MLLKTIYMFDFILLLIILVGCNTSERSGTNIYYQDLDDFKLVGINYTQTIPQTYPFVQEILSTNDEKKFLIFYANDNQVELSYFKDSSGWKQKEEYYETDLEMIAETTISDDTILKVVYEKATKCIHFLSIRSPDLLKIYSDFENCLTYKESKNMKPLLPLARQLETRKIKLEGGNYEISWQKEDTQTNKIVHRNTNCYKAKNYSSYIIFTNDYPYLTKVNCI